MISFRWPFSKKQAAQKSASYGAYGSLSPFVSSSCDIDVFKAFLKGSLLRVDHRLAYTLHDRAAPLSNATNRIAESVAQLDPFVIDPDGVTVEKSAVLETLNNPGFGQTRQQVIEDFTLAFLLTNNAYWITDRFAKTLRNAKPMHVSVRPNVRDSYAEEYRVSSPAGTGQAVFLRQDDWAFQDSTNNRLLHVKTKTTNDGLEGRSPIEPIFTDIGQRIAGGTHNLALLQNGLRPTGNLNTEGELTDEQFDRLKAQIEQENAGAENAGKFLITEGGLKYTDMAKTNREMDYVKILLTSSEAIAQAYKVPLPLVTTSAQTFSNFGQATQSFYDDAVFPVAEIVFDSIGRILQIDSGFRLTFNKNEIPAIRQRRLDEAKTKHQIGAFTDNETRVDLAIEPYEGGDVVYKPGNLVPVGSDDGALDDGKIEGDGKEFKDFIHLCRGDGMTKEKATSLWFSLQH